MNMKREPLSLGNKPALSTSSPKDLFSNKVAEPPTPLLVEPLQGTVEKAPEAPALKPVPSKNPPKHKVGFYFKNEIIDRYKNAYVATSHLTGHQTPSEFAQQAILEYVQKLESQYNEGEQFPEGERPATGRPPKFS